MNEFEKWIAQHYGELLAVAKTLVSRDHEDVVQTAVLAMWNSPDLDLRVALHSTPEKPLAVWPWAKGHVRGAAKSARDTVRRNGTKHLPPHLRGEEKKNRDTRKEERRTVKLPPEKDALRYADQYYLERLEEDRRDFDMDGYGRAKSDKPFEVRFPEDES